MRAFDNEEPVALDGQVRRARTDLDRALGEIGRDLRDFHAQAHLPRIRAAVRVGRLRALAERAEELGGKDDIGGLEAHRLGVGQVVAGHIDLYFGRVESGQRGGHGR